MEFVTSKPTDEERAINDIMLMPKPAKYMSVNAPITEIGIVRAAISIVENLPRNRSKRPAVSPIARRMFWITLLIDSLTASDLSYTRWSSKPLGSVFWISFMRLMTPSETFTTFASERFLISSETEF